MGEQDTRSAERLRRRAEDRLLIRVARHGGPWVALLSVTALMAAATEAVLPALLGRTVDAVLGRADRSWLAWFGLAIAVLLASEVLDDLVTGVTTARSTAGLRHRLLRHVLAVGPGAADRFGSGDLAGRLTGNAAETGRVAPDVVHAAAALLPALGGIVALALIDPWLCLTVLAGVPFLLVMLRTFSRDASAVATRYLQVQGAIAARLTDAVAGARTIAAAGTVDMEVRRVLQPLPELHEAGVEMWRTQSRVAVQDALLVPLLEVAVLAVAGSELARGRITAGELLAAGQYVLLAANLGSAVGFVNRLARARAAAGRAEEVLSEPPVLYGEERLPEGPGRLEFREVTAPSGDHPVLEGLDLVVPGGALVALVGPSGAGKSLLAALAGRLADPAGGEVLLDDVALPCLSRAELRRAVTYGFERPTLIGETIEDVIAFGAEPAPAGAVVTAATAARADAFIRRMPAGYRTRRQEAPMSGGEVQRVGLARAFAHAGRVVILDDVAASLDTVTEHHVSAALTGELAGRTRLVVAHRASTAARADLVVWLEGGRVRRTGSHRSLWADPAYRGLFEPEAKPDAGSGLVAHLESSGEPDGAPVGSAGPPARGALS